jgi:hypothetical protein
VRSVAGRLGGAIVRSTRLCAAQLQDCGEPTRGGLLPLGICAYSKLWVRIKGVSKAGRNGERPRGAFSSQEASERSKCRPSHKEGMTQPDSVAAEAPRGHRGNPCTRLISPSIALGGEFVTIVALVNGVACASLLRHWRPTNPSRARVMRGREITIKPTPDQHLTILCSVRHVVVRPSTVP